MRKKKRNRMISGVLALVALIFTLLVKFLDVKAVGVNGTELGFSTINKYIFNTLGTNDVWYKVTEFLGFIPLILVMVYAFIGFKQLVKEKNIKKVDREIIILGGFYVVVAFFYVLFEKVIINYRPILVEGILEASYPSSHTLMSICFCGSAMLINKKYFPVLTRYGFNILLGLIAGVIVVGRLLAGVHWFTDIVGACLISAALLMLFYTLVEEFKIVKRDRTKKKLK